MCAAHSDTPLRQPGLVLLLTLVSGLSGAALGGCQAPPSKVARIGTFQRRAVLVAYYRSDIHARTLQRLSAARERALAGGDERRAADITARGGALQELAHRQLAGDAPLGDILVHLEDAWPDIARQADVDVIIETPLYTTRATRIVDVTDLIVARLNPAKSSPTREKGL